MNKHKNIKRPKRIAGAELIKDNHKNNRKK